VLFQIASLHAATGDRLDRSGLIATFSENFRQPLSLYDRGTGTGRWKTNFDFGWQEGSSSRVLNDEMQVYSDTNYNGVNPFLVRDGALTITARRNPLPSDPRSASRPYTSGLITTSPSFRQLYGFFEARLSLPRGAGLWPAFWLTVPPDPAVTTPQRPGEIDVMEMLGRNPHTIYCSAHWPNDASGTQESSKTFEVALGDTQRPRDYGVLWTRDSLVWFVDDEEVARLANPGLHRSMVILANLAVGGQWGGVPNEVTVFPAQMVIEYVRAYRLNF
jgi:beta-glucanase (GH16 family)